MATPMDKLMEMRRKAIFRVFNEKFKSKVRITVGSATCENSAGAGAVYDRFKQLIEKHNARDVVLGRVGCSGRCHLEPVVTVISFKEIPIKYVKMTPEKVDEVFDSHILGSKVVRKHTMDGLGGSGKASRVVSICSGPHCLKNGSIEVESAFVKAIEEQGIADSVVLTRSSCHGLCEFGPLAYVYPDNVLYQKLTPEKAERIAAEHLLDGNTVAEYAWTGTRIANRFFPIYGDVHFFGKQLRLTLRNCGVIDPEDIHEYLAVRGYEAAAKVLTEMQPKEVVDAVLKSGLRGRGGAGFPTGLKWRFCAQEKSEEKYIICNADEGDPGAFMDRSCVEGDPHTVIEGLIIGGYAIGATKGFVYIRAEYPLAISRLSKAIEDARSAGILGKNIFGSGKDFDIELRLGAGAFVCGEETALIKSIEGERGMARPRPPYPSSSGLWGKPTVINNVETLANLPVVIVDGPEWFSTIGTEKSKGTKVFALAGHVNNTGLIEVPMGTTLREVVFGVGGGVPNGKKLKAVQTGGPAGGCIPESQLDTPVDYESLAAAGSIMGSGGMIVMDEDTCMVDVARFFIEFMEDESCGKCTPCREGTRRMSEILTRITTGRGEKGDIEKLLRLGDLMQKASLCGLGQAAPNAVLSTINHFRDEYEAHINEKHCPAGVCRAMVTYEIDPEKCTGCGACRVKCPVSCITGEPKKVHIIDQSRCIKCGTCYDVCRFDAIKRK